jgi:hypothetical protein
MPRRKIGETKQPEVPELPPFPSESFDVTVDFADRASDVIKVMAKGRAAAIMTAYYTMQRWPPDKIGQIVGLRLIRPS